MADLDPRWCGPPCANCGLPTATDAAWDEPEAEEASRDWEYQLCWDTPQTCLRPAHDWRAEALEARAQQRLTPEARDVVEAAVAWRKKPMTTRTDGALILAVDALLKAEPGWGRK